jgi:hypothetical protein
MKRIGDIAQADTKRYSIRPRYTMVLHQVREKMGLSLSTYGVIDSIHKLSRSDPRYQWCTMSKENLATFLKLGRTTVFRAITTGVEKGLVERSPAGLLRSTQKWAETVELYSITKR